MHMCNRTLRGTRLQRPLAGIAVRFLVCRDTREGDTLQRSLTAVCTW